MQNEERTIQEIHSVTYKGKTSVLSAVPISNGKNVPNGKNEECLNFLSVHLGPKTIESVNYRFREGTYLVDENVQLKVCKISIVDASGEDKNMIILKAEDSRAGYKFFSRAELFKEKDILLPNDVLTLSCVLLLNKTTESDWNSSCVPLYKRCNLSGKSLTSNLNLQMEDIASMDVALKVDGTEIRAHEELLVYKSPLFAYMFRQKDPENKIREVEITDIEVNVLQELVRFLYTNECSCPDVNFALKLLAAADKCDIQALKTHCAQYLIANVSGNNVLDVMCAADAHGEAELRKHCISIACQQPHWIPKVPGWKSRFSSYPEMLTDLLEQLAVNDVNSRVDREKWERGTRTHDFKVIVVSLLIIFVVLIIFTPDSLGQ